MAGIEKANLFFWEETKGEWETHVVKTYQMFSSMLRLIKTICFFLFFSFQWSSGRRSWTQEWGQNQPVFILFVAWKQWRNMSLPESPFPNKFVKGIHSVGWILIFPCFWCLDRLIAVCKSTTQEQSQRYEQECYLHPLKVFFGSILFFLFFILTAPLAFLGMLLWAPLQACRRPFIYHREAPSSPELETQRGFEITGKASFTFATANLCLLPESLARFNNLGHTLGRASTIGQLIVKSQENVPSNSPSRDHCEEPWEVLPSFPVSLDVLCLEEVFDQRAAQKLTNTLKPVFRHILYDVGVYACQPPCLCSSFKFFNSGMFLASRFPVLEAQYHWFPNSSGEDALAAKGLLSTKVP